MAWTHGPLKNHTPTKGDVECPLLADIFTHLDNIEYTFQIRGLGNPKNSIPGTKKKILVDREEMKLKWRYKGEGKFLGSNGEWQSHSLWGYRNEYGVTYYTPNASTLRICLGKVIFKSLMDRQSLYTVLVDAIVELFEQGVLVTRMSNYRDAAYYILDTRGSCHIESAIDIKGYKMKKSRVDQKGKMYQRALYVRFEVKRSGRMSELKHILKSRKPNTTFIGEFAQRHALNFLDKLNLDVDRIRGMRLGKDRHTNLNKLRRWVSETVLKNDFENLSKEDQAHYVSKEYHGFV